MLGTSLLWRSTEAFTYLKVKSAKCLCLFPMVLVLVLRISSCLHHGFTTNIYTYTQPDILALLLTDQLFSGSIASVLAKVETAFLPDTHFRHSTWQHLLCRVFFIFSCIYPSWSRTCDFLLTFQSNRGPIVHISKILAENCKILWTHVYLMPLLRGFPLELCYCILAI